MALCNKCSCIGGHRYDQVEALPIDLLVFKWWTIAGDQDTWLLAAWRPLLLPPWTGPLSPSVRNDVRNDP